MPFRQNITDFSGSDFLPDAEWTQRTQAGLQWLRNSIEATGGKGSAHSWRPLTGWEKAYPETTGYIIPTLLAYGQRLNDDALIALAERCACWLTTIQLPGGAFPGLLVGSTTPSIFNTSQILFGLAATADRDERIRQSLQRASQWLMSNLEPDFSWKKHGYVPGFTPSYYTRAVWGILKANQVLQNEAVHTAMQEALKYYARRWLANGAVNDWGFEPGKMAFTHTLAYTLEGFLESALLLDNQVVLQRTIAAADHFLRIRAGAGACTAGRYHTDWQGDYRFICPTGNAQLSVFFYRLQEETGSEAYRQAAESLLQEILPYQKLKGADPGRVGALPGSAPFWGAYLPFRYPNWAVKFLLDALLLAKKQG